MVAKRVPGQLGCEPMILMEVFPIVREDQIRRDGRFQVFEELLDVSSAVGQEAVAEVAHDDLLALGSSKARLSRELARLRTDLELGWSSRSFRLG